MNIIKFKDIVKPCDDMFNAYLKNKYAYWVHMRYVIPMDFITPEEYVAIESDVDKILNTPNHGVDKHYWDLYKDEALLAYVDTEMTDTVNSITTYQRHNKFVSDPDITIEELKKFRTWLAQTLLEFDQDIKGNQKHQFYTEDFTHVLQYYANGMYDDVVKNLAIFGKPIINYENTTTPCGCGSNDLSGLYNSSLIACDPLDIYRNNIHQAMVEKFSDVDFWADMSQIFLIEFKRYIDNIIRINLPLYRKSYVSNFNDCPCGSQTAQELGIMALKKLSTALDYIINEDVPGHRNAIADAFSNWSEMLYELMEW